MLSSKQPTYSYCPVPFEGNPRLLYWGAVASQKKPICCSPKFGSPRFMVQLAVPLYDGVLIWAFGTEQNSDAVAFWPAYKIVPSARSTLLTAPMRPASPKGGLETVKDKPAALR